MAFSERERLIFIVTLCIIMAVVLYKFILTPVFDARGEILAEKQQLNREIEKAYALIDQKDQVNKEWEEMMDGGLNSDVSATESMILNAMRAWAQSYGLTLTSIKPERDKDKGEVMQEIQFNVACSGNMSSVGQFLWHVENTTLPLRIKEFQLGAREEDGKEMSLQLKLSALYLVEAVGQTAPEI